MTRTTRIVDLVDAHLWGDDDRFHAALASIIRDLRAQQHHQAAGQLAERLRVPSTGSPAGVLSQFSHRAAAKDVSERTPGLTRPTRSAQPAYLVHEAPALRTLHSLQLNRQTYTSALHLLGDLRAGAPSACVGATVILGGRRGNGRSSLGEAIAHESGSSDFGVQLRV